MKRTIRTLIPAAILVVWFAKAHAEPPGATPPPTNGVGFLGGILMAVSAAGSLAASKAWDYFQNKKRNDARDDLGTSVDVTANATLNRQEVRIRTLEGRIDDLEARLDSEQNLRRTFQDRYFRIRQRQIVLEGIMREHDIPVPIFPDTPSGDDTPPPPSSKTPPTGG